MDQAFHCFSRKAIFLEIICRTDMNYKYIFVYRSPAFEHYEVMRVAGGYKVNVENPVRLRFFVTDNIKNLCISF